MILASKDSDISGFGGLSCSSVTQTLCQRLLDFYEVVAWLANSDLHDGANKAYQKKPRSGQQ